MTWWRTVKIENREKMPMCPHWLASQKDWIRIGLMLLDLFIRLKGSMSHRCEVVVAQQQLKLTSRRFHFKWHRTESSHAHATSIPTFKVTVFPSAYTDWSPPHEKQAWSTLVSKQSNFYCSAFCTGCCKNSNTPNSLTTYYCEKNVCEYGSCELTVRLRVNKIFRWFTLSIKSTFRKCSVDNILLTTFYYLILREKYMWIRHTRFGCAGFLYLPFSSNTWEVSLVR